MGAKMRYYLFSIMLFAMGTINPSVAALAEQNEKLLMTGTGSCIGTMQLMGAALQRKYSPILVEVLPSIGSTGGIKAVSEGKIHIGLTSRPLKTEEESKGLKALPYGRTAFIFGVQDANPVKGLSLKEIEEIYAGKRTTWDDGAPIRLILRPLSDTASAYLGGISPALKTASEKAHSTPGVFVGITDQEAALQIERTPGSFGTTTGSVVASEQRRIKALAVDGIPPTITNLSSGKYPYSMTLYMVYKTTEYQGALKKFVEFVFSDGGRKLLADLGHVTLPLRTGAVSP